MLSDTALEKKRRFAEERAARLKDPRQRAIGIDVAGLAEQVKEKDGMKKLDKERDQFFDQQRLQMDKHAQVLQREVDGVRRTQAEEVDSYRRTYQKKEMNREWDLNNPRRIVDALPARVGDTDIRLGASSAQKFEGEDLDAANRRRLQMQQQREWATAQMDEKMMKKWMEQDGTRQYEDRAEEMARRTYEIERSVAAQRAAAAKTTADFNRALEEQKRQASLRGRSDNTQRNLEEIENMLNSDLLNERKTDFAVTRAENKGMTADQRREIMEEQASQRDQLAERRRQEAEEQKQSELLEQMQNRMAQTLDRQQQRERRERLRDQRQENERMSMEAKDRKKALDQVYANDVGEEYFEPFGKCL